MTHRLDVSKAQELVTLQFQGLLDAGALADLRAAVHAAAASGARARVLLREGSEVERSCIDALRELAAEVVAESAYLARWIREGGNR